jgi:hypothetical protein
MIRCAVIDLKTNQQVNFIIAEDTANAPDGYKYVEIPNGYYWNQYAGQVLLSLQYWDGTQVQTRPEGTYWSQAAKQLLDNTQYWDGKKIKTIPDGYYWDITESQLMSLE